MMTRLYPNGYKTLWRLNGYSWQFVRLIKPKEN